MTSHEPPSDIADYGPSGYLPQRAATRARKIVLRAPMGLQWPVAAGVAAVLVLVLGVVYVMTRTGPPADPYVQAGSLSAVDPRGSAVLPVAGEQALVVRGGGGVNAFLAPDARNPLLTAEAAWCTDSRRIESADGRVWTADGRLVGGAGESLTPLNVSVYDGDLYIDVRTARPAPPASPRGEEPPCRAP